MMKMCTEIISWRCICQNSNVPRRNTIRNRTREHVQARHADKYLLLWSHKIKLGKIHPLGIVTSV